MFKSEAIVVITVTIKVAFITIRAIKQLHSKVAVTIITIVVIKFKVEDLSKITMVLTWRDLVTMRD